MNEEAIGLAEAVSAAAAALSSPDGRLRELSLVELKKLYVTCVGESCTTNSEVARVALESVRRALLDADAGIRVDAMRAIELLAPDAEGEMPGLLRSLDDPAAIVRVAALEALAEFGRAATVASVRVGRMLTEAPSAQERSLAASVLTNLGAQAEYAEALIDALLGDDVVVQVSAAHALAEGLGDERSECRDKISRALHLRATKK